MPVGAGLLLATMRPSPYAPGVTTSVLVLGAGFGGLELSSRLAAAVGDEVEITLIDRSDSFVFGFSKLDMMFGAGGLDQVLLSYSNMSWPQVRFRQETITSIDAASPVKYTVLPGTFSQ